MITKAVLAASIALASSINECPSQLETFEVERVEVEGGLLYTTGFQHTDERLVNVSYIDNRRTVSDEFISNGNVSLINLLHQPLWRLVKYRQSVTLPSGTWCVLESNGIEVCIDDNDIILYKEEKINFYYPHSFVWSVTVVNEDYHGGDINGDGFVDGGDLGLVLGGWGKLYDSNDLSIVLSNWSSSQ